jgi:exo-beta-1,3-glucanase (GH17 family)
MNIINYGRAICYSGYRDGQSPINEVFPSYDEILEDLKILEKHYDYIRMYDSSEYTKRTLEVIKRENIQLKVLIGMDLLGEISNHNCEWGGTFTVTQLARNIAYNQKQLQQAIELAQEYESNIIAVSAGNEAVPIWNENLVSPARILYMVHQLKKYCNVPVTYCDNVHEWHSNLIEVAEAVDFISVHIYPVWEGKNVSESITEFKAQFQSIKNKYTNKQVIITETGWPTKSNSHQILPMIANEKNQMIFNTNIINWTEDHKTICFLFEAFDEPWKGSNLEDEPEKHWGLYYENRKPKLIVKNKK